MKYFATSALLVLAVAGCTAFAPPLSWEGWQEQPAGPHPVAASAPSWLARSGALPFTPAPAVDGVREPAADTSL